MNDTKPHIYYLHIFLLVGFALAQPLYDLIRQYPTFIVAHDVRPLQLILFAALISFVIPLALVVMQSVVGVFSRSGRLGIHRVLVFVFSILIFSPIIKKVISGPFLVVFAVIAGGLLTYGYFRIRSVRTVFTILTPAVLIFPALFLFTGPVANVLLPGNERVTDGVTMGSTPPIVYIIFDEFSSVSLMDENRNIDADRFPNIAAFARDAHWCRNATTNGSSTQYAVPALLTGAFPAGDREVLPIQKNYPGSLFTLLHEHYAYNIIEPITELCPDRFKEQSEDISFGSFLKDVGLVYAHVISPDGVSERLPSVSHDWAGFLYGQAAPAYTYDQVSRSESADSTTMDWDSKMKSIMFKPKKREEFREFVASIAEQPQPSFNFYHCPLPHRPHSYLPSTREYDAREFLLAHDDQTIWFDDPVLTGIAFQRYIFQLQFVDTLVGELIEALKNSGLYDPSLIILTSDHGVNHEPGEYRRILSEDNYDEILPVPLFIKLPHQKAGVVDDRNIESVDVVPTIADVLDVEPNWTLDGTTILDPSTPRRSRKSVYRGELGITYYDAQFEEKYSALARTLVRGGTGKDPMALFRIGPHGDLVGKTTEEIPSTMALEKWVRINGANALQNVRVNSPVVPVVVSGQVIDAHQRRYERPLAISLNGVIVSVTSSYVKKQRNPGRVEHFACLIPESALRDGDNTVDVYVIGEDTRGKRRLELLESR